MIASTKWSAVRRLVQLLSACHHTCPWEEVTILVEGHSHDAVCGIKGLLHTVTMMYINVDVQHPEQQQGPIT